MNEFDLFEGLTTNKDEESKESRFNTVNFSTIGSDSNKKNDSIDSNNSLDQSNNFALVSIDLALIICLLNEKVF